MWNYECVNSGEDYLAHHGILGMKWGVRRYQNSNGTLTAAGKKRYSLNKEDVTERDWSGRKRTDENWSGKKNTHEIWGKDRYKITDAMSLTGSRPEYDPILTEVDYYIKYRKSKERYHKAVNKVNSILEKHGKSKVPDFVTKVHDYNARQQYIKNKLKRQQDFYGKSPI